MSSYGSFRFSMKGFPTMREDYLREKWPGSFRHSPLRVESNRQNQTHSLTLQPNLNSNPGRGSRRSYEKCGDFCAL